MKILQQARLRKFEARRSFNPLVLSDARVVALRFLATDFLTAHGLTVASPSIAKIGAVVDSVARYTIHPYQPFHMGASNASSNLDVLVGTAQTTWAGIISNIWVGTRTVTDNTYWGTLYRDGFTMANVLFGTVTLATGVRANDGMLAQISAGRYRIKDLTTFKFMQCSQQNSLLGALLGSLGYQTMLVSTTGHDTMCVWIPELSKWVWADSTYNEMLQKDGNGIPLSPFEVFRLSAGGSTQRARITPIKFTGPSWDSAVYIDPAQASCTYFMDGHPLGTRVLVSRLDSSALLPGFVQPDRAVVLDTPGLQDASSVPFQGASFIRSPLSVVYPDLGAGFRRVITYAEGDTLIALDNNWPATTKYQRRVNGGAWVDFPSAAELLPDNTGTVEYRPVDAQGFIGSSAVIST